MATALRADLLAVNAMAIIADVGIVGRGDPCGMRNRFSVKAHGAHINGSGSGHAGRGGTASIVIIVIILSAYPAGGKGKR